MIVKFSDDKLKCCDGCYNRRVLRVNTGLCSICSDSMEQPTQETVTFMQQLHSHVNKVLFKNGE